MHSVFGDVTYYQQHHEALGEAVRELVEAAKLGDNDDPAVRFATLCLALDRDHDRAVTVAAVALMLLADGRVDHGQE
jgi:hypothetical protein